MLTEIEESRKDLQTLKEELAESRSEADALLRESDEQKNRLRELQDISDEQKESYERLLREAERKNTFALTLTGISGAGCAVLAVMLMILLI